MDAVRPEPGAAAAKRVGRACAARRQRGRACLDSDALPGRVIASSLEHPMAAAASDAAAPAAPSPHLHHPWVDALFGYGLFYLLSAPAVVWLAARTGLSDWPVWFATLAALLISVPHYGATYLRVYEKRAERRRYALFAVHLTVVLSALYVASLYSVTLGSILLTIYVYWSPWHFAGQNFGVAMTSLRRRQVEIDPLSRRLLYSAFLLGYALAALALSRLGSNYQAVVGTGEGSAYTFMRLGIPDSIATPLLYGLAPAYAIVTVAAIARLARKASIRALAPTVSLLATHSLWYALPAVLTRQIPLLYAGVWISALHAVQYLWITSHYARRSDGVAAPAFFARCALIGSAVAVVPPLIFAPGLLGGVAPLSAQAAIVFFSVMNIHHFVLDGAVWKLRDGRVARALLDDRVFDDDADPRPRGPSPMRIAIYAVGLVALLLPAWVTFETMRAASSPDHAVVESAARRLAFLGRDDADVSFVLGQHRAIAEDREGAIRAYRKTLELAPDHPGASYRLAGLLLSDRDTRAEALTLARAAAEATYYRDPAALIVLGRANLANGQLAPARAALQNAASVARQLGDRELAQIATRLLRLAASRAGDAPRGVGGRRPTRPGPPPG